MIDKVISGGGVHRFSFYDVICIENIFLAWKKFKKGKRAKKDVAEFEFDLENNIFDLHHRLINREWSPDPYIEFYVQDPKLRKIHKATVRDRVLYQVLYQKLYEIFDKTFIHDVYSSRDLKGIHKGVERLEEFSCKITENYTSNAFILKCDIRKFFDSIDHTILISLIRRKVNDKDLMELIIKIIDSFHKGQGKGLPLGNVTSQIMSNIYLNELDQFIKHALKVEYYIRYCDDFVILNSSEEQLKELLRKIDSFLEDKLKLKLHPNKISIRKI